MFKLNNSMLFKQNIHKCDLIPVIRSRVRKSGQPFDLNPDFILSFELNNGIDPNFKV